MNLEQLLADVREEAALLRRHGHKVQADSIESVCDRVRQCMAAYLDWLTEEEAVARSGRSANWLRGQLPEWEVIGMAKRDGRRRWYRRVIVPRRPNLEAARADAIREAQRIA